MKTDIHPQYKETMFKCACGSAFKAGSTLKDKDFNTEICSQCHPFYTGKQKLIDSSGRVDKFMEKRKNAQLKADAKAKLLKGDDDDDIENETVEEEKMKEEAEESTVETLEEIAEEEDAESAEESSEATVESKVETTTQATEEEEEA